MNGTLRVSTFLDGKTVTIPGYYAGISGALVKAQTLANASRRDHYVVEGPEKKLVRVVCPQKGFVPL